MDLRERSRSSDSMLRGRLATTYHTVQISGALSLGHSPCQST